MSIFHHKTKVDKPADVPAAPRSATPGVVVTCKKCGHKQEIVITAGRAKGGTFAMCPKCGNGGIYDEYGQEYNYAQAAAQDLIRKYGSL
jgi:RNase P subunit RPR2